MRACGGLLYEQRLGRAAAASGALNGPDGTPDLNSLLTNPAFLSFAEAVSAADRLRDFGLRFGFRWPWLYRVCPSQPGSVGHRDTEGYSARVGTRRVGHSAAAACHAAPLCATAGPTLDALLLSNVARECVMRAAAR